MDIYLPIAEVSLDVFVLLGLGTAVGFLSGVFGVGGGFLLTPLLIFIGVPPAVAVASSANQLVGASVSGVLAHWKRGNVDFKMGGVLLVGGFLGSLLGVWLFGILRRLGLPRRKLHQHTWIHGLPLKMRFRRSKLYISALLPLGLGFLIGILSAIM